MNKLTFGCVFLMLSVANVFAADDANQPSVSDSVSQSVSKTVNAIDSAGSTIKSNSTVAVHKSKLAIDASGSPSPVKAHYHPQVRSSSRSTKGVINNLIELERKKNAWLKRTFLGK